MGKRLEKKNKNDKTLMVIMVVLCVTVIYLSTAVVIAISDANKPMSKEEPEVIVATMPDIVEISIEEVVEPEEPEVEEIDIYPVDLDADLQRYIIKKCGEYMLNPSVVIAVCYYESGFRTDVVGDSGASMGLMGISPKWCWPEMERLGCDDMTDPYQNVTVGIDILAQKMAKYDGNPHMALMSYNAGDAGANTYWFSKGIYSTEYSNNVMNMSYALDHGEEW